MDYTAQGLTTNLAARMQQAADPGSVLVAAATWRLAEGYFRFRPVGALRVRGAADPIEAYLLEGEGTVVSRLEASLRRGVSPFRGREAELRSLGEAWERAVGGHGEAICLVGEPGIGKSRLAYELEHHLGITERVEGMALAHARGAPYFVFRQLLRQLAGVAPDADLAAVRDALHRRLWDISSDAAVAPDILSILGTSCETLAQRPGGAGDERRDRVREAVVAWLVAECRKAPRLVRVEDVQWLDPSSEELCRHLAVAAGRVPLLLVMTSRLPVAGTGLELAGVREIGLSALGREDIQELVDAQLEPYPASERLRRLVATRAEGNPFYVEELVRVFRDRGDLVLDHGAYDVRESADTAVPPTIHALIAARIDRLPASSRELVADAAVLGQRLPLAHLRALAAHDDFEEDLAQLERRGLLVRETGGPVATLSFRHVLTQEVAYTTLLQADRQSRHRRAAEMLESLYRGRREEVCEQLAYHWLRSDRRVAALPNLLTAAEGAVAIGANREAIGHLQGALDLATEHPEVITAPERDAIRLKLAGLYFVVEER
jgi:predicted ATPase